MNHFPRLNFWLFVLLPFAGLAITWPIKQSVASTVTFDNYVSPTNNDLTNNFNQTGAQTPYSQSQTGGVEGGAVVGYYGSQYQATGVYTPNSFAFSSPGSSVALSMDLYYNAQFQPLAAGANAVRSFRLGLLTSPSSAFETTGNAEAYIEGDYALDLNQMILVGRNATNTAMTSLTLAQVTLTPNHWYQLDATIGNQGNGQVSYTGSFLDMGTDGKAAPIVLSTWNWSYANASMTSVTSAYAGFSALANGGITRMDNFTTPTPAPIPNTFWLFGSGLIGLAQFTRRRGEP